MENQTRHTLCMRWYERDQVKKVFLLSGVTLAVYLFMRFMLPIVIPFLLGGLLAVLLNPVVERVVNKTGRGRSMISMIIVTIVLAAAGALCYFAGCAVCDQLSELAKNAESIENSIRDLWCDGCARVEESFGVQLGEAEQMFARMQNKVKTGFQSRTLPYLLKNSVTFARIMFAGIGVTLVSVISGMLILTDYPQISSAVHKSEIGKLAVQVKQHAKAAGGTYLKAQIIILLIISLICVAGLFLTGNPYAVLAGMGIGVCDALPFIGTGTIFVPWMIIDILNGKYVMAAVYGILYIICSFVRQLLEPRLIGARLGYPPIVVLMSIYIGIYVYGAGGVLTGPASAFLIYELYTACRTAMEK